ncbi:endonuclease domain-containing protein [Parvularcula marina]|nr:DUF559 domain-containing protein [Parvularcula marina]
MADLAENRLAECLERAARGEARFVRGARLGPHMVDFFCMEARLVVELDCAPLRTESARTAHRLRLRSLEQRGYRVLRFWADHVEAAPASVERLVRQALGRGRRPLRHATPAPMPIAA